MIHFQVIRFTNKQTRKKKNKIKQQTNPDKSHQTNKTTKFLIKKKNTTETFQKRKVKWSLFLVKEIIIIKQNKINQNETQQNRKLKKTNKFMKDRETKIQKKTINIHNKHPIT